MKKFNLCGVAIAALVLLSSCLGDSEGSSKMDLSGILGVVTTSDRTFKTVVRTAVGDIYNESIETMGFVPGSCIQMSCVYDSSNPNNASDATNGYVYVTMTGTPTSVNKVNVNLMMADTTTLLNDNEIALENPIATSSVGYDYHPNIGGYMFLTSSFKGMTEQKNDWYMYFDMNQTPLEENGNNTYVFVLRAVKKDEGKAPSGTIGSLNAFQIQSILNQLNMKEVGNNKSQFNVCIKYLKAINEEDNTPEWAYSKFIQFSTSKEQS